MEKKDKLTIIVFAFLVISIITLVGINYYKNRPLKNGWILTFFLL